jgi:ABC-type lipoprotein release transport system permease subunit
MWLLQLAWKNLWRNRNRTLITMAAIFFAVLLSVLTSSLKAGIFDNLVKNLVSNYSGYIQVHQKGYWEEQLLDNSFETSLLVQNQIRNEKAVTALSPRLESFALASSGELTKGCLVIGIDPKKENKITYLQSSLKQGRYIDSNDKGVLISAGLLERMKLKLDDTLVLIGQGYHGATAAGKYPIIGVVGFAAPDLNDKVLYMPIRLAQDLYGAPNRATAYVLSINHTETINSIAQETQTKVGNTYEVMTWEQMMPEIKQHIESDSRSMQVIQAILYLLISFGIFGTLLMMMAERRFELGMLVAIGMKKQMLAFLLLFESVFTVLLGCIIGIIASIPLVYYFNIHPIKLGGEVGKVYEKFGFEAIFPTSLHSEHFVNQGLVVLIIGLILSLYPVYQIIILKPVEAMRK